MYFKGWPSPQSMYMSDIKWASKKGIEYMQKIKRAYGQKIRQYNMVVIFDVDETLVFGDPDDSIGVKEMELGDHGGQTVFILPPNPPIVKMAAEAKEMGFKVIILTARPNCSKMATVTNLDMFKIPYDSVIVNDRDEDPAFKLRVRRKLAQKYNVVLTVGDQVCDVLLPGKAAFIKLPEPDLKGSYAYFP